MKDPLDELLELGPLCPPKALDELVGQRVAVLLQDLQRSAAEAEAGKVRQPRGELVLSKLR